MNQKIKTLCNWLLHFAVLWAGIFLFTILPYIIYTPVGKWYNPTSDTRWEYFLHHMFKWYDLLVMAITLLLIEIGYQYVFKRYKWALYLLTCFFIGIMSFALLLTVFPERIMFQGSLHDITPVLMVAAYAFVYALVRDYLYQLRYKKAIKLQQSQNELNALKAQLNPHFLFNSLNYLYGTALAENATQTADGIDRMAEMMRYTIAGMHENFVPLTNEVKFIENFIALQQARLPVKDNIKINVQINVAQQNLKIAPLLLLPFIENAFKYGISIDSPCDISIKINVADGRLTMEVNNLVIKNHTEVKGNNTGIKNTIKRLNLLYPDDYKLECNDNGNNYTSTLSLKLKTI